MKNTFLSTTAALALVIGLGAGAANAQDQNNASLGVVSLNTGFVAATGVQGTAFAQKASQDVTGVGAIASVDQKNVDGDDDQTNVAALVGALNVAPVAAVGAQGNLLVGKASQSVGAFGAQASVDQKNVDSDDDQTNVTVLVGALNTAPVAASGLQGNLLVGKASQSVSAGGAGSFVTQTNKQNFGEDDQTNITAGVVAVNLAPVAASGTQINLLVGKGTQTVGASGASVGVTQLNRDTDGTQNNAVLGVGSANFGPVAASGLQVNVVGRNFSQSVSAVGSSTGVSQTNKFND